MVDTTRITVTLPTDQVAERRKLPDNVSGYVAEAALRQPGPVVMLTSGVDGMARLCGDLVRLIGTWGRPQQLPAVFRCLWVSPPASLGFVVARGWRTVAHHSPSGGNPPCSGHDR
ncbi:hypothetical protein [Streptomyces hirsutus]|uniref:hypothetical protein n=1 Tax=Streptomyces hirsutus TaxID=35620 RepID=UPI0036A129B6